MKSVLQTPRRLRRGLIAGVAALGVAALLAGCSSGGGNTSGNGGAQTPATAADPHSPELSEVKITGIAGPGLVPLAVTMDKYASEYGLKITFVPADNSGVAVTQVVSGDVAAANTSYFGVIDAINQGLPLEVIAEGWASTPNTGSLEALPSSGIKELKDLIGKKVNVISLTSSHAIKLRASMIAAGLDPDQVSWVELPYAEVANALQQGTIDASSAVGPTLAAVKGLGSVTVFDYGADPYQGMAESGYVSSQDFITKYPNTTAAIQCAIFAGQEAVKNDRALYEQYFQSFLKGSAAAAAADVMLDYQTTNRIDALNRNVEVYKDSGLLTQDFDYADHTLAAPGNC